MADQPKMTPIDQSLVSRVANGLKYMFTGNTGFFSPLDPIEPVAQKEAHGRQFDYAAGYNINVKPRANEPVDFVTLRAMADSYDLLRLVIETRKDQMARLKWTIKPTDDKAEADKRCEELQKFFKYPNREDTWDVWFRALLEDLLVLDAPVIFPRKTRGGGIYALELMDGATIKRVLDDGGRTPIPPYPAYQQVLKGVPAVDYTADEIIYARRNKRTNRVYGYSPVEQVLMTVNIALRRQVHQLQFYTEGNIPEALISVPTEWTPEQVAQFQAYWDSILEGDTASRRHAKFVPGGVNIEMVRPDGLKDEFDEWLARIICYAFSVSPSALIRDQNRATADSQAEMAQAEGLEPMMNWAQNVMTMVIQRHFGYDDLEFCFLDEKSNDPKTVAEVNKIYIDAGVKTVNEVRAELGMEPLDEQEKEETASQSGKQGNNDEESPKEKPTFKFDFHMPEQKFPEIRFEPVIDVQSPNIEVHLPKK